MDTRAAEFLSREAPYDVPRNNERADEIRTIVGRAQRYEVCDDRTGDLRNERRGPPVASRLLHVAAKVV